MMKAGSVLLSLRVSAKSDLAGTQWTEASVNPAAFQRELKQIARTRVEEDASALMLTIAA